MRAVAGAGAAVDADERVILAVPLDRAERARLTTRAAGGALVGGPSNAPAVPRNECSRRTSSRARGIVAGAADDDDEPAAHPAGRSHVDARALRPGMTLTAGASIDAKLTADATVDVDDGESLGHGGSRPLYRHGGRPANRAWAVGLRGRRVRSCDDISRQGCENREVWGSWRERRARCRLQMETPSVHSLAAAKPARPIGNACDRYEMVKSGWSWCDRSSAAPWRSLHERVDSRKHKSTSSIIRRDCNS